MRMGCSSRGSRQRKLGLDLSPAGRAADNITPERLKPANRQNTRRQRPTPRVPPQPQPFANTHESQVERLGQVIEAQPKGVRARWQQKDHFSLLARPQMIKLALVLRLGPAAGHVGFDGCPLARKMERLTTAVADAQRDEPGLCSNIVQHTTGFHTHQLQLDRARRRPRRGSPHSNRARCRNRYPDEPPRAHGWKVGCSRAPGKLAAVPDNHTLLFNCSTHLTTSTPLTSLPLLLRAFVVRFARYSAGHCSVSTDLPRGTPKLRVSLIVVGPGSFGRKQVGGMPRNHFFSVKR